MLTPLRALAALAFALVPAAAAAEGAAFTVPAQYVTGNPGDTGDMPFYRLWSRAGGPSHKLVVTSSEATRELSLAVDGSEIGARESGAIDVDRKDAAPLCGAPSVQLSYAHANEGRTTSRYVVVAGRLLVASYMRPTGGPDDPAALAALSTLCSGVYQSAGPRGWTIAAGSPPNTGAWRSPDGRESFSESAFGATAAPGIAGGTVTSDSRTTCGTIAYRRFTETHGGFVGEHAVVAMGAYSYALAYLRPSARPVNASALAALTGFCGGS